MSLSFQEYLHFLRPYHKEYEVRKPAEDESPHDDSELCCRLLLLCQHIRSVPPIPSHLSLCASAEELAQKWLHAVCTGITRFCLLYLAGLADFVSYLYLVIYASLNLK